MRYGTSPCTPAAQPRVDLNRRDTLRLAAAGLAIPKSLISLQQSRRPAKRVIVAGAGIGGLCCAYELMDRGHDVTVLEAAGRAGR